MHWFRFTEMGMNYSACPERIFCATPKAWTTAIPLLPSREGKICSPLQKGEGLGERFLSSKKTFFDGTKLPLEGARPKTTTYSMKLLLSPKLDDSESPQFATSTT